MAQAQLIHGIIAYPITPFSDGGIDVDRLTVLVDRMVNAGVHAVAPLGSTSESAYLSFDEWKTVLDTTVAAVAARVPVVVGSSDLTTAGTVARAEYAEQAGATAVMVLPISYFYNGSNPLVLEALLAGASGWCTAAPCLRPAPVIALYEAVAAGDPDRAKQIYDELLPLLSFIVSRGLPTAVKSGLDVLGEPAGVPRLPLLPLDAEDHNHLESILAQV